MADGVRLYFETFGSGPQVVLPNGFHLIDDFAQLADRHTLIFYDVRNRGLSDSVERGSILDDAEDLDAIRRHFGIERLDLIAHSYIGILAGLYAMQHPNRVNRIVKIGPMQPDSTKQYPPHLTGADATLAEVFGKLGELQKTLDPAMDPQAACEKFWSVLRPLYVFNPADAEKIQWGRCDLPNERNFMGYFQGQILPSIYQIKFSAETLSGVKTPVLIIHGNKDRSAPYGGALDWAAIYPNAQLVTVENAAHAPWIEDPEKVLGAIESFLN
jgi:pimeloyl-ACP methyl ester carboxylesterase